MRESDRMRLLVVDACDTMSRMSDRVMLDAGTGISEHLEELFLSADEKRAEDLVASCIMVVISILKPLNEQTMASTSGRKKRSKEPLNEIYQP